MIRVARLAGALALGGLLLCGPIPNASPLQALESQSAEERLDRAALPLPLAPADAALYRAIFAAQAENDFAAADRKIAALGSDLLLGHVLAQRYLATDAYRATFEELAAWLERYADHPAAAPIHSLALTRLPQGQDAEAAPLLVEPLPNPASQAGPMRHRPASYASPRDRDAEERAQVEEIRQALNEAIGEGGMEQARALLESEPAASLLDSVEADQGLAKLARSHYQRGESEAALALAGEAAERSGAKVPEARWIAGLAAWRLGRFETAAHHFSRYADSKVVSDWARAGGAFWAGRSYAKLGRDSDAALWFTRAAAYPHSFYGLIALRALEAELPFDFTEKPLTVPQARLLLAQPEGRRAFALLQAGRKDLAREELLRLGGWAEPEVAEALLATARVSGLPALSYRLAQRLRKLKDRPEITGLDAAFYPLPPWRPRQGFAVDRALLFAMMRKESRFDPEAVSPGGASGLMQIMPATASYLDGQDYSGAAAKQLFDPAHNISLGQDYLAHLLGSKSTGGDLFHLAAAYNGGPGNLGRWKEGLGEIDDPLLFIESLPALETRVFIEHVLTSYWIYRLRLGADTHSLDAVAKGLWPRYDPTDRPPPFDLAQRGAD